MSKYDIMDSLVLESNGYLLSSRAQAEGISRTYLSKYVADHEMERVDAGIYILPDTWVDPLYVLQLKNREILFSYETALYLYGLMEHEPKHISISVKRGYNISHLKKYGIKPHFVDPDLFGLGTATVKTVYGNEVRAYDMDRLICEVIKRKSHMDVQVFQTAIRQYMKSENKNLHNLMNYAKLLKVENIVRMYTEVLL